MQTLDIGNFYLIILKQSSELILKTYIQKRQHH